MAMMQRLVHKQFNSPINLYSQRNIQETLDRELKQLSNGAIGIDFDDPSTTKPPSLAKSAVLQALEEEERQQSRGKGWQQPRPSRSRQRDAGAGKDGGAERRTRTPCIDRETVLRINRRPLRHRSCDNFWPPARSPSPLESRSPAVGGVEGGSFAYEGVLRYGSHESVYFDERVRKQHKIDPLRTMFDKANVVLVDWGRKGGGGGSCERKGLTDNGVYDRRRQEKVGVDDAGNNSIKQGEVIESERRSPQTAPAELGVKGLWDEGAVFGCEWEPKPRPPSPPPRRYYLQTEQLQSGGVGMEILLRCYESSFSRDESQDIPASKIDDGTESRQQAHRPTSASSAPFGDDGVLHQDGIQSKPPVKTRTTPPTKRTFSSKPPTPIHFANVNHNGSHNPDDPTTKRDDFNINSNTILNLNIDSTSKPPTPTPLITVTDWHQEDGLTNHFDKQHSPHHHLRQPQQLTTVAPKTNDQLLNEIIDENHNYNEKLITNSGRSDAGPDPTRIFPEVPNEQHSKLNVSNQPNRNWINLNSNEIYPHAANWDQAVSEDEGVAPAAARMTKTRVRCDSSVDADDDGSSVPRLTSPALATNDGHQAGLDSAVIHRSTTSSGDARYNYDNKSVKSNYWQSGSEPSSLPLEDTSDNSKLRRSESRDSAKSWRVEDVLEFPPPPPYLCVCDNWKSPSGRCSEERPGESEFEAQICDNRSLAHTPVAPPSIHQQLSSSGADNPTISQSCRRDSSRGPVSSAATDDVCPSFSRWDDNRSDDATGVDRVGGVGVAGVGQQLADDYFKTNLTDDKFLSKNVNIACNLSRGQNKYHQLGRGQDSASAGHRGTNGEADARRQAPNFNPLHKSIDAFLFHERHPSNDGTPSVVAPTAAASENSTPGVSFTDGEYIFGPYDEQSEEFQRFDLWSSDFHKRQNFRHKPDSGGKKWSPCRSDGSSGDTLLPPPQDQCSECSGENSVTSSETLKADVHSDGESAGKTPKWRQQNRSGQVDNYDDTQGNVPAGNESPRPAASYRRWVRFENGNISPPASASTSMTQRVPTPYPSPTPTDDEQQQQQHQELFDQFAAAMAVDQQHQHQQRQQQNVQRAPDLVENVPLIDAVLDDLLTFSKTLVLRQSSGSAEDLALATGREEAKIVEINDDNLINLLADDDNSGVGTENMTRDGGDALGQNFPSKQGSDEEAAKRQENSGDESFREEKCDQNANEPLGQQKDPTLGSVDDSKDVLDNYLSRRRNQEDIFANVAIFNWNPLDVYHQHGLFMIDPRFALADLHGTAPTTDIVVTGHGQSKDASYNEPTSSSYGGSGSGQKRNDAHLNSPKREQASNDEHPAVRGREDDDDTAAAIGIVEITDGADPSSADVNSFATQRAEDRAASAFLESHKIPNDRASPALDHFYDSAHVEYPVWPDLRFGTATTTKECHQSPVESDYDNDPAKNTNLKEQPTRTTGGEEGLKRVAWPPSAEGGDEYEQQQPLQPQQQQYYQQPSPQPHHQPVAYQQPQPQQQYQPYPQQQQQQQQQHQPRERIIPIQRATSHISPLHTPKSPVNQLKYPPSYPPSSPHTLSTPQHPGQQRRAVSPLGGSTVAFRGGRAVLPQQQQHQQQQQQQQQQRSRPVSASYYQQPQLQQQHTRYPSPSTASLASPRSPQIVGGGGHSPRGWAHVKSPVPLYRPTPQQRQQQQSYVPPPFQAASAPYQQASAGYAFGYGPRKPEPSTQQPQYQPQATQAFQPLVSQQHLQQQQQQPTQQQLYQPPEAIPQQQFYQQPDQVPFITTLRKEPPMSQEPAPVYQTQPVAAIYQGGSNMRGDQKWPPAEYKKQSDVDNEERLKLAQQPAFRPRKVQKDYSNFFAKNALNQTYPGYRAPPGTQHHD